MCIKRKNMFVYAVVALSLIATGASGAQARYWHTKDGEEFVGAYEKAVFGNVYFRGLDGKLFKVASADLVESDKAFISASFTPEVEVRFTKKIRKITDYPDNYDPSAWDDSEMEITGLVSVTKKRGIPYSGKLRGEVYLIGEEVATDDYRLFGKKGFTVSFPGEKSNVFECEIKKTLRTYTMNGNLERGAHYKGYVVVIESFAGDLVAFESNLSWMNEEKIAALRKLSCPGFLDENCKKRSVPRPEDYRTPNVGSY